MEEVLLDPSTRCSPKPPWESKEGWAATPGTKLPALLEARTGQPTSLSSRGTSAGTSRGRAATRAYSTGAEICAGMARFINRVRVASEPILRKWLEMDSVYSKEAEQRKLWKIIQAGIKEGTDRRAQRAQEERDALFKPRFATYPKNFGELHDYDWADNREDSEVELPRGSQFELDGVQWIEEHALASDSDFFPGSPRTDVSELPHVSTKSSKADWASVPKTTFSKDWAAASKTSSMQDWASVSKTSFVPSTVSMAPRPRVDPVWCDARNGFMRLPEIGGCGHSSSAASWRSGSTTSWGRSASYGPAISKSSGTSSNGRGARDNFASSGGGPVGTSSWYLQQSMTKNKIAGNNTIQIPSALICVSARRPDLPLAPRTIRR
eukprot:TRINITY_DN23102_c0_g1_i1.p1 TRINITY_DN23102_c0_g1~~TRINITY_DN23102_c0_g1_i1.p1  ORF type:complete len:380 (+),score=49.24 TRINITY_DN23102_c0_g1_i1:65-1204(+)